MRVLIIEDERKLADIIGRGFRAEGFAVDLAYDGAQGLELASAFAYDAIILDIMLPKMSGTEVLHRLRERQYQAPVLILTARDSIADKVRHMSEGADDYLTKPFAFSELLVRIRALLRRGHVQRMDVIAVGDLEMDRLGRQVKRSGRRIDLSAKEYALLEYLMLNAGRVLSRHMIIEHVWDQSFDGLTNIVDVYIRQLRGKIDTAPATKLIRTVRGSGYVLSDGQGA